MVSQDGRPFLDVLVAGGLQFENFMAGVFIIQFVCVRVQARTGLGCSEGFGDCGSGFVLPFLVNLHH